VRGEDTKYWLISIQARFAVSQLKSHSITFQRHLSISEGKAPKHGRKSVDKWIHYYANEKTRDRLLYNAMNEARKREYRKEDHDYFQEIKLQLRHMHVYNQTSQNP